MKLYWLFAWRSMRDEATVLDIDKCKLKLKNVAEKNIQYHVN